MVAKQNLFTTSGFVSSNGIVPLSFRTQLDQAIWYNFSNPDKNGYGTARNDRQMILVFDRILPLTDSCCIWELCSFFKGLKYELIKYWNKIKQE